MKTKTRLLVALAAASLPASLLASTAMPPVQVSEPGAFGLLALGVAAAALVIRLRRRP